MTTDEMEAFEDFIKDFHDNVQVQGEIQFPITVASINGKSVPNSTAKTGRWVAIRPCDDEKTYLGVYLGDMNIAPHFSFHTKTHVLSIASQTNPAIYVPDLKRVVWGYESWWGTINKLEDFKKITDADIQNIWYVKALRELMDNELTENKKES